MRKAVICSMLALSTLVAACGTADDNPTAIGARPASTVDTNTDTSTGTGATTGPDATAPADSTGTEPGVGAAVDGPFEIEWGRDKDGLQAGTLEVPIDYDDPSQGNFTLHMVRHLALDSKKRIGTLLVNPGGPGAEGISLAQQAELIYGEDLLDRFDILGWDPRGVGTSTPAIDCYDDYDRFFNSTDITPDTDAETQAIVDNAQEIAHECEADNAAIVQHVGTNDSAKDIDAIRQALGEDRISFFGFSYGSELGATWATLFPDTVRAAVLDGAADPNEDGAEMNVTQFAAFEKSLDTFLAQCSDNSRCEFHNGGDAEGAFDSVMERMDEHPLPALDGRPDLTRGAALQGVIEAMYDDAMWPTLAQALDDAQGGDGSGLMELYDQYYRRSDDGTYDNLMEAFNVISCVDDPERDTVAEDDAVAAQVHAVAPRLAPGTTGGYFCTFFPPSTAPRVTITGTGAGPIVVVGTTGDPSTPLESSRAMADALEDGVLVVVHANRHTGYRVNDCVDEAVDDYLVDPTNVPQDGLECK